MKKVTSITLHTTAEGQRVSYTYSEIDEDTGHVLENNTRESLVVLNISKNSDVLAAINTVTQYVTEKLGN